jgi:hypothetical protein
VKQDLPFFVIEVSKNGLPLVVTGPSGKNVVIAPEAVGNAMLSGNEDGVCQRMV